MLSKTKQKGFFKYFLQSLLQFFALLTLTQKARTHTALQSNSRSLFQWQEIKISAVMKTNAVFRLIPQNFILNGGNRVRVAAKIGNLSAIYDVLKCMNLESETEHHKINRTSSREPQRDLFIERRPQLVAKPQESGQIPVLIVLQFRFQFDDELWKEEAASFFQFRFRFVKWCPSSTDEFSYWAAILNSPTSTKLSINQTNVFSELPNSL